MKIYSSAVYFCNYSIHFNEKKYSTAKGAGCRDGPGNTITDAEGNRAINIRELKEEMFEKVRSLTSGRQKPTGQVEIMYDWIICQ